ncbi:MAG: ABC transporter permease [Bryobacteraceae bacterium]|nr:ABC transporter permease [Bryobacteraceae bacterium]
METVKQEVRSAGWESAAESLCQDIRYGARQLLRSPGFSAAAVLTLALGIGANTAIFTLLHAVILKPLPVSNPHQLYRIGEGDLCCLWGGLQRDWGIFSYPFYQHLSAHTTAFEQIAAFQTNAPTFSFRRVSSTAPAQPITGELVSGNYFSTLGVDAIAGRLLNPADDRPGAPAVAVMSYRMWHQRYASDNSIIGSAVLVNGLLFTLAGIAPPGFFGDRLTSDPPDLWLPLNQGPAIEGQGQKSLLYASGMAWLYLIGRVKPGVELLPLQSQLSTELQQWLSAEGRSDGKPDTILKQRIRLVPAGTGIASIRSKSKNGLYFLSIASILVLLIACANLANLLLARGAARYHQTALRLSLGATRARLVRAVLTESVLLSLTGGMAGLLLAWAGTKAILLIAFRGATYVPIDASPSLPVVGFAFLLSLLTAVIFGVVPAWIGTRADPAESLRGGHRSTSNRSARSQKVLVVVQAALAIVLLAVAGLVTQSLRNLESADLGFQTGGRLIATISGINAGYKPSQLPALYQRLQDRLGQIPGVRSASLSQHSPQIACCLNTSIGIGGRSDVWISDVNVAYFRVGPKYFETIGTPLLRGRTITDQDTPASRHVAVVDEAFARKFFREEDPIGKHFGQSLSGHSYDYEIVGVVKDTRYRQLTTTQSPMYFVPLVQTIQYGVSGYDRLESETTYANFIQLNVAGAPESYETSVRQILAGIDPNLSAIAVKSYSEQVAVQFNQERLIARLAGIFSLFALLLASVGLYGVTAYNVTRRTSEIGIRVALGANRGNVVCMVLRGVFSQVGIGLCIGLPIAVLCGRYLENQLYGVGRFDPFVLGGATLALTVCSLVAGMLPARRAASVAPLDALRTE